MENKKLTKKEKFAMVMEYVTDNEMLTEFLQNEINLLTKKANSSVKSKTQIENESIKERILAILVENKDSQYTITEFQNTFEEFAVGKYTNQKLSALFNQLVDKQELVKVIDKKKTYFKANV